MADVEDVVVIARIVREGRAISYSTRTAPSSVTSNYGNNFADWKDTSQQATAAVSIKLTDDSKLPEAKTAAENVARVLARIEADLDAIDPNTPVTWHGYTMTAQTVLNIIHSTKFVITDQSEFNNGGVGSANAENHTDMLYYESFDGDGGDYASPNYVNDAGLVGILLHEIGHLSDAGDDFLNDSRHYFRQEHDGKLDGFYGSDYGRNNEKFANDFAYAAGQAFAENLSGVNLTYGRNAMDPETLHLIHTSQAPVGHDGNVSMV